MSESDCNNPAVYHFIGIGGISMSGIAKLLLNGGFKVSGSDNTKSALTEELEEAGATVFYGQKASNIPADCEIVVYSAAIRTDNPEYAEAVRRGLPMFSRAELLGMIMKNYQNAAAVAGTHGKTTTTGMLSEIFMAAGLDPTISIGGILPSIGGNFRIGGNRMFLTEACEYTNSFLELCPDMEVILNIEADHLDFFKDIDDIRASFREFTRRLDSDGVLIINAEIEDLGYFTEGASCKCITYGVDVPADYQAVNIEYNDSAVPSFNVLRKGKDIGRFSLNVPGVHNAGNAVAAIALSEHLGIDMETVRAGLKAFAGTERRFQKKGEFNGVILVDDYAHHPTEIRASLTAAAAVPHRKLMCIFQPHTYSRTAAFLDNFADALSLADEIVLAEIYAARETNTIGISSADLCDKLTAMGKKAVFFPTFEEIEDYVLKNTAPGDLVFTMGAGNVNRIGEDILEKVK